MLTRAALNSPHRWVSTHGAPGVGKTTLLAQTVEQLRSTGAPHIAVWEPRTDPRSATELLKESGFTVESSADFTVIIDDFDWMIADGRAKDLAEIFKRHPRLRVMTASLDPLDPLVYLPVGEEFGIIRSTDLGFSPHEVQAYCAAVEKLQITASPIDERTRLALWSSTGGLPLAVVLAVDRWNASPAPTEAFNVEASLWPIRSVVHTQYPPAIFTQGTCLLGLFLALMPRFTDAHLEMLAKDLPPVSISDLTFQIGLDPAYGAGYQRYAWRKSAWRAFLQWNTHTDEARRTLVSMLLERGDLPEAFDQLVLLEDYSAADSMLRKSFALIYEQTSPEVESMLLDKSDRNLQHYPYLRAFVALLERSSRKSTLAMCGEEFMRLANEEGCVDDANLVSALSALMLARSGQTEKALSLAASALRELPGDTSTELEAAYVALSVFIMCGTFPTIELLPSALSKALAPRHPLLIQLVATLRGEPTAEVIGTLGSEQRNFRSLRQRNSGLEAETDKWISLDERLVTSPAEQKLHSEPVLGVPDFEQPAEFFESIRLLSSGNVSAALVVSEGQDVPEPSATLTRALVRLATGQGEAATRLLARFDAASYGARVRTVAAALSAAAFLREDLTLQAEIPLRDLARAQRAHLIFALSLLSNSDLAAITAAAESPIIHRAVEAARAHGAVGGGKLIPETLRAQTLTPREQEIVRLLQKGLSDKEISEACFVSLNTTKSQLQSLRKKLGVRGRQNILAHVQEFHLLEDRRQR